MKFKETKMKYDITENATFNSREIHFNEKPPRAVIDALKALKFRWHSARGIWYGYAIRDEIENAINGATTDAHTVPSSSDRPKAKKALASLWDRTRTNALPAYGQKNNNFVRDEIAKITEARGWDYDRAAADYFRHHLRERFPECKFSITSGGAGWLYAVDIRIIATPYAMQTIKGDPTADDWRDRYDRREPCDALAAVLDYCKALHKAADADDGDIYADYGAHHDLYGSADISGSYTQTEPTDATRADVDAFRAAKAEAEERERAEAERIYKEECARREIEVAEAAERERVFAERAAEVEARAIVEEIPEADQIAVTALKMGCGKEASAAELAETLNDPEYTPHETDAIISRRVTLNAAGLELFASRYLYYWTFCAGGLGGSESVDNRLSADGYADYLKMNAEQRDSVKWFSVNCIGIYNEGGALVYVIDPQGYEYARYVMIPTEATETIPAAEYRRREAAASDEKPEIYTPAPIAEQISAAGLEAGEGITVLTVGAIMDAETYAGRLESLAPCEYAQYKDAARLIFTPDGKRAPRQLVFHSGGETLIYRGILPAIPASLKYIDIGGNMRRVMTCGDGVYDYLRRAIDFYAAQGFSPVIDTWQRLKARAAV